ncbi:MAG TPA: glucosaminidase domain-containing protein [Ferruginibacter sp.]|nr:glucosaminidase domain-containing protein [Ferruginibacter sp.]
MHKTGTAVLFCFISLTLHAQSLTVEQYIDRYKDIAITEMKRMGIPASITLAQGILETENGNSILVKKSNNHFGIKCKSAWMGESVAHTDDAPNECFRKYPTPEDSYRDHSNYLRQTPRYSFLFDLEPTDYKGWAYGLKKAGYATNPRYPQILIKNIEQYNLQQYNEQEFRKDPIIDVTKIADDKNQEKMIEITVPVVKVGETVSTKMPKTFFNGIRAFFATRGTSLLAIATRGELSLSRLLEFNDLEADGLIKEDQWIYLEKKSKQGNRSYYTAIQNESLYSISQNNGVQLAYLAQYNNLGVHAQVKAGTRIKLKPVVMGLSEPVPAENVKTHLVKPKEGLYAIAKQYNVSVDELREWNNLDDSGLKPGQELIISK